MFVVNTANAANERTFLNPKNKSTTMKQTKKTELSCK